MNINFTGLGKDIADGAVLLQEQLGFIIDNDGIAVRISSCENGLRVHVTNKSAEIYYKKPVNFFRALAITIDALKKGKEIDVAHTSAFDTCGLMFDVSRRSVMKVETVKRMMRYMACMGLGRLMLYTEDVYEIEGYPYFGYMRGRYTKDEIKEMVAYGNLLGIESVPCIQTLAHLEHTLRWEAFSDVRGAKDNLLVGEEKTYELIEEMIKTARECYTTSEIHIGMDEAFDVNLGKYLEKHGYSDRLEVLCDHIQRVDGIVKKYGFRPMMWSDMFTSRMKKNYDDKLRATLTRIPEDMSMVFWEYDWRSEALFDRNFNLVAEIGRPVVYAGGIHTWDGINVHYNITFESMLAALRTAKKHGIKDVFLCIWNEQGAECDISETLLAWQYLAELNYNSKVEKDELYRMFEVCTGHNADFFPLLDCDDYNNRPYPSMDIPMELNGQPYPSITVTSQVLYQNPLYGLFDKNFEAVDLPSHYKKLYEKIKTVTVPKGFESIYEYHCQLLRILISKCSIGIRIKKAYDGKDMAELKKICGELDTLAKDIRTLCDLRAKLWYENNKPFGFEVIISRMMAVMGLAENAAVRIRSYINGETDSLPEVEAERLPYTVKGEKFEYEFCAERIMIP